MSFGIGDIQYKLDRIEELRENIKNDLFRVVEFKPFTYFLVISFNFETNRLDVNFLDQYFQETSLLNSHPSVIQTVAEIKAKLNLFIEGKTEFDIPLDKQAIEKFLRFHKQHAKGMENIALTDSNGEMLVTT